MRNNLSSLIIKNLQSTINQNVIATKKNNKWIWRDKNYLLNSIYYCREYLQYENIEKGDRIAYKGSNSIEWLSWNIA